MRERGSKEGRRRGRREGGRRGAGAIWEGGKCARRSEQGVGQRVEVKVRG